MPRSRSSRRLAAGVLLVITALPTVAACGRDLPAVPGAQAVASTERSDPVELSGPTLDGGTLDLADLRGRIVVLNNWASWCPPCKEEMPAFVTLSEQSDPADLVVVGMNVTDDHDAAVALVDQLGVAYPVIEDPQGQLIRQLPGIPPSSLPSTVILDREGRIAARIVGKTDALELGTLIARVVADDLASGGESAAG